MPLLESGVAQGSLPRECHLARNHAQHLGPQAAPEPSRVQTAARDPWSPTRHRAALLGTRDCCHHLVGSRESPNTNLTASKRHRKPSIDVGHTRPSMEPLIAAPCRQRWLSERVLLVPGMVGGSPPRSSCRGAQSCQACGISRAPSPYAHRCPQQRWPMLPATCVWLRTPRALWRSSLPSGCKVSCREQATPGDSPAEEGLMLRAYSHCRQTQHLVPPQRPPPVPPVS